MSRIRIGMNRVFLCVKACGIMLAQSHSPQVGTNWIKQTKFKMLEKLIERYTPKICLLSTLTELKNAEKNDELI